MVSWSQCDTVKLWAPGGGIALQECIADLCADVAQAGGGVRQEQGGAPVHRANVAQHVEVPAGPRGGKSKKSSGVTRFGAAGYVTGRLTPSMWRQRMWPRGYFLTV